MSSAATTQPPIPVDPDFLPESLHVAHPVPSVNLHPMQTRSKSGISKKKLFYLLLLLGILLLLSQVHSNLPALRAWNEKFTSFLPGLGFKASFVNPSLFVQTSSLGVVVLLLYVDDIIIIGSDSSLIFDVVLALTKEFDMKDLGQLHYFLGLQISYQTSGLFVSQIKYTQDLLHKMDMQDSKSCVTPCLPSHSLIKDDGKPYKHSKQYKSIVGVLQYLTFTRPDIAFAFNQCCEFMQQPMECHVVPVKRILRYLNGTISYGINFQPERLHLQAYSDAAPMISCDSISAIALSSNPVFHSRVKHIEIDYHFVREKVTIGDLNVQHVSSKEQFADILTKGMSNSLFVHHCSNKGDVKI
ncbi:unnamed protein product [Malus baccata var. baccata]